MTLEEVLNGRMIADPITLYMCSPSTDGASAAVLCAKEVAHRFTGDPVTVAGWASGTPEYSNTGVGGDVAEGRPDTPDNRPIGDGVLPKAEVSVPDEDRDRGVPERNRRD